MTYIPSDDELSKLAISGGFIDCLFDAADTRIHGDYDQGVDEATRDMVRYARKVLALVGNKPALDRQSQWQWLSDSEALAYARAIETAIRAKNSGEQNG